MTSKIRIILPRAKPRNPVLVPGLMRQAGPHGKTRKAARQAQRQQTLRYLARLLDEEATEFEIDG